MNCLALSVWFWRMSITGLYFAGNIGSNAQLKKVISGELNKDVVISCKYADAIQKPTLAPKISTQFSKAKVAEMSSLQWSYYKHANDRKRVAIIANTSDLNRCASFFHYSSSIISLHTAQLHIRGLIGSDAGFYFCSRIGYKREPDISQLIIKAVSISQVSFLSTPLEENKPAILYLNIIRFYPKKILVDWYAGKEKLQPSSLVSVETRCDGSFNAMSMIAFVPQANDHSKFINCYITHENTRIPKTLQLQVSYGPVNLTVRPEGEIVKIEDEPLELLCISNSNPKAKMSWMLNGTVLLSRVTNHLKLQVENISLSDQGNYVCSAENRLGTRFTTVQVDVIGSLKPGATDRQTRLVSGISVGVVLLLIIVTVLAIYAFKRRRRVARPEVGEPVYMVKAKCHICSELSPV
ncbi:sialic acid-binding Ig-like lectin 12 isoform X2 [Mustelus asterias]